MATKPYIEITAEIIYDRHKTGHYYETFLKCKSTGIIHYYRGNSFHNDFKMGDVVSFEAKIKRKRSKPVKFKQSEWNYNEQALETYEFEYHHDIWYPKNIVKLALTEAK